MSTLEELWNKGALKPESYPQLIRMLQRERNDQAALVKQAMDAISDVRGQMRELTASLMKDRSTN